MIDENKLKTAVENFIQNPYWKSYLEEAPSENCKRNIELDFYYSCFLGKMSDDEKKEVFKEKKETADKFGIEDWQHLLKYCGHNPLRTRYSNKIKELKAAQEAEKEKENQNEAEQKTE